MELMSVRWCLLLLLSAGPVWAQSVAIAVVSAEGRRPIAPVALTVFNSDGRIVVPTQVTDSFGQRVIPLPGRGKFRVEARKLGYEGGSTNEFSVDSGETKRYEIALKPLAQDLAPVEVRGKANFEQRAFASRQRTSNGGRLLTRQQLDSLDIKHLSDAVRLASGADAYRGRLGIWEFTTRQRELDITLGRGACPVSYYWNGMRMSPKDEWAFDFLVSIDPKDVTALEIYPTKLSVPAEFSLGQPCAAVVVWTKPGITRPPAPS